MHLAAQNATASDFRGTQSKFSASGSMFTSITPTRPKKRKSSSRSRLS